MCKTTFQFERFDTPNLNIFLHHVIVFHGCSHFCNYQFQHKHYFSPSLREELICGSNIDKSRVCICIYIECFVLIALLGHFEFDYVFARSNFYRNFPTLSALHICMLKYLNSIKILKNILNLNILKSKIL